MIFFTSDQHFGHKNILKYCNRPYKTIENHDKDLIEQWNKIIHWGDHVYVLGDFCYRPKSWYPIIKHLNGNITFIRGNHDPKRIPDSAFDACNIMQPNNTNYFVEELVLKIDGVRYRLSHYPYCNDFEAGQLNDRGGLIHNPIVRDDEILLHGHVHLKWKKCGNMINVGVDLWDYKPVSLLQIQEILKNENC